MIYFRTKEDADTHKEEFFNLFRNAHTNRILLGDNSDYDSDGILRISKYERYDPVKDEISIYYPMEDELPDEFYIPDWGSSATFYQNGLEIASGIYRCYSYMDGGDEERKLQVVSSSIKLGTAPNLGRYLSYHPVIDTYIRLSIHGSDLTFKMSLNNNEGRGYEAVKQMIYLEKDTFFDIFPHLIRLPRKSAYGFLYGQDYSDIGMPESINLYMPFYYLHPLIRALSKNMVLYASDFVARWYRCVTKININIYRDVDKATYKLFKDGYPVVPEKIGEKLTVMDFEMILQRLQIYPYGMTYQKVGTNEYEITVLGKIPMRVRLIN